MSVATKERNRNDRKKEIRVENERETKIKK
jgi:hypothetical protein